MAVRDDCFTPKGGHAQHLYQCPPVPGSGHLSAGASGSTIGRVSTARLCLGRAVLQTAYTTRETAKNRARFAGYEQIFNRSCNQMGDNRPYARGRSSNFIKLYVFVAIGEILRVVCAAATTAGKGFYLHCYRGAPHLNFA